ncbi:hypothetical protein V2J09_011940 [Rumex salicifolius]
MNSLAVRAVASATASSGLTMFLTSVAAPLSWLFLSRSYRAVTAAAASQPQFDYDSYYNECSGQRQVQCDRRIPAPEVDTEGAYPVRTVNWAFIGDPSTKKHVYADMISKLLEVPHISIASLVRQELRPSSVLYKEVRILKSVSNFELCPIANAISHGKLVPESIVFGFLSKRLEDGYQRGETGFILDGLPRTRLQALSPKYMSVPRRYIVLTCFFRKSLTSWLILIWLSISNAPKVAAELLIKSAANAGLNLSPEEAESNMSRFYKQRVEQLEEYYRNQKKLIDFQVGNAPRDTWKGLLSVLRLQHLNAARSSHALDTGTGFRKP